MKHLAGLSVRTANALLAEGCYTRESVEALANLKLLRVPGMGIKSVQEVCQWLGRPSPANTTDLYRQSRASDTQHAYGERIASAVKWLEANGYAVTKLSKEESE